MRQGPFEVIVHPAGNPYKPFEETVIDGKTYLHAEPGEYVVVVKVITGREHEVEGKLLSAKVIIDGMQDKTYRKVTAEDKKTCLVDPFKCFVSGDQRIYFNFALPAIKEAPLPEEPQAVGPKVGRIVVQVHECELRHHTLRPHPAVIAADTTVSEAKNFWKQPTLCTAGGRVTKRNPSQQTTAYSRRNLVDTIELLYHTAGTIRFLQNISTKMGQETTQTLSTQAASASNPQASSIVGKKRKTQVIVDLTEEG